MFGPINGISSAARFSPVMASKATTSAVAADGVDGTMVFTPLIPGLSEPQNRALRGVVGPVGRDQVRVSDPQGQDGVGTNYDVAGFTVKVMPTDRNFPESDFRNGGIVVTSPVRREVILRDGSVQR